MMLRPAKEREGKPQQSVKISGGGHLGRTQYVINPKGLNGA